MRNEVIQIRCSALEKKRWKEAAAAQQMELSAWIRLRLDKATRPASATYVTMPTNLLDNQ